jgi:hypothetical protein
MHNPYGKYFTSFAAVKKQMKIHSTEAALIQQGSHFRR